MNPLVSPHIPSPHLTPILPSSHRYHHNHNYTPHYHNLNTTHSPSPIHHKTSTLNTKMPPSLSWPKSLSLSLPTHTSSHFTTTLSTTTLTLTTLTIILCPLAYKNYKTYLSYGPGGAPYNLLGWFGVTFLLYPFGRNMTSTTIYEKKIASGETESFISEDVDTLLGELKRERAVVGPHYVPQRQVVEGEFAGEEVREVSCLFIYL
ncbi:hypothetical protein BO94DRAFT_110937 [Aspergillus sclerotioniger CBS 115572]|uniref:Uncharacterized protein n=1 Tax=Aspergillus sclerotioniger CBS 115572 TaxID=1450535 RepID=A0A317WKK0_9EURO|nr:hypothetical protein BO94DRAFT_110937 [Aspergillus sclerotioniger CBS 115572]PWY84720.1 hypothetical protein BO94DRAFT_110937 [Aspergillus sclerotioniger CBS 115572]